jgi:co-chaperonin GroES (HSP10)
MNIQPTLDRILISPIEEVEDVAGLEIVRDQKNREMQTGIVVAAGPEASFAKGTKVMYNSAAGTLVRFLVDGVYENYRMMHSDSIQAFIYV